MSNTLNFNTVKKQYLTVTLADEKKTILMIGTPTKKVMSNLLALNESLEDIQEDTEYSDEIMDNLYTSCAKIMSANKAGIEITKDYLEDIFDFEDILIFFNAYMNFIDGISKSKN